MEHMNGLINFGEEKVLVFDGCNFEDVERFLVQNELKYPYYWNEDTEVCYETSIKDILDVAWNAPKEFSIKGLENYYGVQELNLIMRIHKAALHEMGSR